MIQQFLSGKNYAYYTSILAKHSTPCFEPFCLRHLLHDNLARTRFSPFSLAKDLVYAASGKKKIKTEKGPETNVSEPWCTKAIQIRTGFFLCECLLNIVKGDGLCSFFVVE